MPLYKLDKEVFSIRNDAEHFLNGLTSNALGQPQNAFLNIHGKIIATFDQIQNESDHYLIVLERPFVTEVLNHLERYARLSKVKIDKQDYYVYFDLHNQAVPDKREFVVPQKKGQVIITPQEYQSTVTDEEFTRFRLKNAIPVQGIDYNDEFLLNVSEEDFVSFTKGCFLGQEPVSKVHGRSRPTWRLVVKYEDECTEEEKGKLTSRIMDKETGRTSGFVFERRL